MNVLFKNRESRGGNGKESTLYIMGKIRHRSKNMESTTAPGKGMLSCIMVLLCALLLLSGCVSTKVPVSSSEKQTAKRNRAVKEDVAGTAAQAGDKAGEKEQLFNEKAAEKEQLLNEKAAEKEQMFSAKADKKSSSGNKALQKEAVAVNQPVNVLRDKKSADPVDKEALIHGDTLEEPSQKPQTDHAGNRIVDPFKTMEGGPAATKRNSSLTKSSRLAPSEPQGKAIPIELAFDNADLFEVLDATLFELYKVNYIIDPHVKTKVSFHFTGKYTKSQFIELLNDILQLSNLSITKGPGDMFKVVRKNESAALTTQELYEDSLPMFSGDISRMIKLRYLDATAAAGSVRAFASKGAAISVDKVNNLIIVTDTRENIEKIINILVLMDVPYFLDISWKIFPVREAEAKSIAADITKMIRTSGLYYRPGAVKGGYQIINIDSMNAILVASRWPEIIDLVGNWINAMDHLGEDDSTGTGVFVYFVENGTAVEMADILQQLYGADRTSYSDRTQITRPNKNKKNTANDKKNNTPFTIGKNTGDLAGEVEIIPDETNNAIVFKASHRDYRIIKSVLKELDIVPRQVLINVTIAEVTLSDNMEYGVQWLLSNKSSSENTKIIGGFNNGKGVLSRAASDTVVNLNYLVNRNLGAADVLTGLVNALDEDSELNVLSSPNIMAVDNKEAYIEVGEDVPTVTGKTTNSTNANVDAEGNVNNAIITETVQYQKTGIILKVTPHINSSGLVKMELSQEVSSASSTTGAGGNKSINTRKAETSLVVNDGQTILMGGLMESTVNNKVSGVPFLKDIPYLGHLFSSTEKKNEKTELIFLITPHVVDSREGADRITQEFADKIESVKELLENKDK